MSGSQNTLKSDSVSLRNIRVHTNIPGRLSPAGKTSSVCVRNQKNPAKYSIGLLLFNGVPSGAF
jgi:hypothetical protein